MGQGFSNHQLCHKGAPDIQPSQAVIWLVGKVDGHTLTNSAPWSNWTLTVRLSPADLTLSTLLRTGPYKTYSPPNRFLMVTVKAKVESVVEDLTEMGEEPISLLVADQPFPFTYDGTSLTEDCTLPDYRFDPSNFKDQSSVGVEVKVLGYQWPGKDPSYSLSMQSLYYLAPPLYAYTDHAVERQGLVPH